MTAEPDRGSAGHASRLPRRMASRRQVSIRDAVQLLIPSTEIAPWSQEFVEDLRLPKAEQDQVLFELICLQILAIQLAVVEELGGEAEKLDELLSAYHQYWSTYSQAVSVNYGEEVFRRLPLYREAAFGQETGGSLQAGKVFAQLCGITRANFAAFGTNVFANTYGVAAGMIHSLDIEFSD